MHIKGDILEMRDKRLETSVVIIIFNRIDRASQILKQLEVVEPQKLFIISDGPRNVTEAEVVEKVRALFENLSWECQVYKNYAEKNMGCDKRIISGLNWVFQKTESAIILEDDCLPNKSFFTFCDDLLKYYKDESQVAYISGTNIGNVSKIKEDYYFAYRSSNWGWATWARAWNTFVPNILLWNKLNEDNKLYRLYPNKTAKILTDELSIGLKQEPYPWDYLWLCHCINNNWVSITPKKNLIMNIGFSGDATHTFDKPFFYKVSQYEIEFPIKHQHQVERDLRSECLWINKMKESLFHKLFRKVTLLIQIVKKRRNTV